MKTFTQMLTPLLVATLFVPTSVAQSQTRTPASEQTAGTIDENGVPNFSGERMSHRPIVCSQGCAIPVGVYRNCFYNETLFTGDVVVSDRDLCDQWLCDTTGYEQLVACLECIISNGNERPFGYEYNSSLTAAPTGSPVSELQNPLGGYLNETLANEWLSNVVGYCDDVDMPLDDVTTTIDASPTTTGPYNYRATSGQTVNFTAWTGLTEYSDRFSATGELPWEAAFSTIMSNFEAGSTGGQYTPTGAGASADAPPAATSSPNAGVAVVPTGAYGAVLAVLGLMWV